MTYTRDTLQNIKQKEDYMKITKAHYETLKSLIQNEVQTRSGGDGPLAKLKLDEYKRSLVGKCKDVDTRFRWDLFWFIKQDERNSIMKQIYDYADDTHLNTALKKIVVDLNY